MITHYIKIAVRNLLRYKAQSAVSLLGLAVAFACVSLAVYWNHYEHTFDSFHRNSDRIYLVAYQPPMVSRVSTNTLPELAPRLKERYPEVENVCVFRRDVESYKEATLNGVALPADVKAEFVSPEVQDVFDVDWVEGNENIDSWRENQIAIASHVAEHVCGKHSAVGLKLITERGKEYEVVAVYKTWPHHSNFKFGIMKKFHKESFSSDISIKTYVQLKPHINCEQFLQKLQADTISSSTIMGFSQVYNILTPLQAIHYTYPRTERNIRLNDVHLFTVAAVLLAFCALLNYLTLFLSRLRGRGRDMALRAICGSSNWQTSKLLMTEYLLLLLCALLLSLLFIEIFMNKFVELSQLQIERFSVYIACGYLILFIIALATLLSFIPIYYFKRKTLRVQMEIASVPSGKNRFRIAGVCLQLFVSILFMFCATVMIRQVHYLIHADINIERKQIAYMSAPDIDVDRVMDIMRQMPCITEVLPLEIPLFPATNSGERHFRDWEGKAADALPIVCRVVALDNDVARFYGLKMKEGPESFDLGVGEIFINETMANELNMTNPIIGKMIENYRIKGIVYDYQNQPPTESVQAICFRDMYPIPKFYVAFKYTGDFKACREAMAKAFETVELPEDIRRRYPDSPKYRLYDGEEVYNNYLKSEYNLLKLLSAVTLVSLLIALFGIYALIMQECERHRKEIAIRKVNGAKVKDILAMFFRQYMLQVVVASLVAFPLGYVLMKKWLEGYSRQVGIDIWLFLAIFVGVSLLVTLCIGWRVWQAANENPAHVVKKE